MILAVFFLILGLIAGLARGGKLSNISRLELRLPLLVFTGLAIQIGAEVAGAFFLPRLGGSGAGVAVLAVSYLALIVFLAVNRHLPGALLIGAGLGLNLLVIVLNGGMPVSVRAAEVAGLDASRIFDSAVKHTPMGPDTTFKILGDVIPLPFVASVISIGDVILGIGVFVLVSKVVGYEPRRLSGGNA